MKILRTCLITAGFIASVFCIPILSYAYTSIHGNLGSSSVNNGAIGIQYPGNLAGGPAVTRFRVLIPPGTVRISLQMTVQNNSNLYAVARLKRPPENLLSTPPYDPGVGYTFARLETEDCYATTIGGGINIVNDAWAAPLSMTRADWLYVDIMNGYNIYWIKYQVYFDKTAYELWYSRINDWSQVEAGNIIPSGMTIEGDLNCDLSITLSDAILALQLLSSTSPVSAFCLRDVNADGKIGLEELIYILQTVAVMR